MRVLRPDGLIFLIAPSAGPIHRYPVDCYRFYPDAFSALAKHAGGVLVESWLDERGPWRDLVGVFCRAEAPSFEPVVARAISPSPGGTVSPGRQRKRRSKAKFPICECLIDCIGSSRPPIIWR